VDGSYCRLRSCVLSTCHDHAKLAACVPTSGLSESPDAPVKGRRTGRRPGGGAVIKDGDAPHPEAKDAGIGDADTAGFDPGRVGPSDEVVRGSCVGGTDPGGKPAQGRLVKRAAPTSPRSGVTGPEGLGLRSGRVFQGNP
jgi:hypothetical protein